MAAWDTQVSLQGQLHSWTKLKVFFLILFLLNTSPVRASFTFKFILAKYFNAISSIFQVLQNSASKTFSELPLVLTHADDSHLKSLKPVINISASRVKIYYRTKQCNTHGQRTYNIFFFLSSKNSTHLPQNPYLAWLQPRPLLRTKSSVLSFTGKAVLLWSSKNSIATANIRPYTSR